MSAPLYEKSEEMKNIIEELYEKRKDLFGEMQNFIFPEMIQCVLRTDKQAPKGNKYILKIKGITGPVAAITPIKYVIFGYFDAWHSCNFESKVAHMANMLRRIKYPSQEELDDLAKKGMDYEYGKTEKPDISDFKTFIDAFGTAWSAGDKVAIQNLLDDVNIKV